MGLSLIKRKIYFQQKINEKNTHKTISMNLYYTHHLFSVEDEFISTTIFHLFNEINISSFIMKFSVDIGKLFH